MAMPSNVFIRELGPREGFQALRQLIPCEQKVMIIDALSGTGVKAIEVASFVRADLLPQMADAEQVALKIKRHPGVAYVPLALNLKGFERARAVGTLECQGWIYTAASATFLKHNSNTTQQEIVLSLPAWALAFRSAGLGSAAVMISTAFGCSFEGPTDLNAMLAHLAALQSGLAENAITLTEISLADTVGHATPELVRRTVGQVRRAFPTVAIALHLHDTRGLGLANAYAGLLEGIDRFDASVGGIGGCPFTPGAAGNVATEELVHLCETSGVSTGIDLKRYIQVAQLCEQIIGASLPGRLYRNMSIG